MDTINEVTCECFNAINQLRESDVTLVAPESVYDRLNGFVEQVKQKARERGLADRDAQDIVYALVALADEVALGKPEPLRGYWSSRPMQLAIFGENLAGEGFFDRLKLIRTDRRRLDVLRVYYLCLLFGFQGRYAIRGGELELMRLIEACRSDVQAGGDTPSELSPNGDPPDEPLVRREGRNPFVFLALGVFALAIAAFIGLRISLDRQVSDLSDTVEEMTK